MQLTLKDDLPFVKMTVTYGKAEIEIPSVLVDTGSATTILAADIVAHGKTGFIVRSDDPVEWAGYLEKLISNKILCKEFGLQARADIVASFGWESIAVQIESIFRRIKVGTCK